MESRTVKRKLTAIVCADVHGYSRLMGEDEIATIRTLGVYRKSVAALVQAHSGRVIDTAGDSILAEFTSVIEALRCAVAIQRELGARNAALPESRRMQLRIGINLGEVVVEGDRIYGNGVNIAARLEGLAEPGGICISGSVHDQVEDKLADMDLSCDTLGAQAVKNIAKPVRAYSVRFDAALPPAAHSPGAPSAAAIDASSAVPDKPSIAVLPFTNLSGEPGQEYFSDGITEDLLTDLSKLSGLFVISRNSVFMYKDTTVKPEQIGSELGARFLLEGSVRKVSNRVRITAKLVDTATGYQLWADRYDRELDDIFAVQDEVVRRIITALEVKITTGENRRLGRVPTKNVEAYEYFLRGLEAYARRTPETNALAGEMFEHAIALDPEFAAAYARLGRVHMTQRMFQWSDDGDLPERAAALANQALAIDPTLPGAHQTLAYVRLLSRQFDEAVAEARQAVALDPNDADACITLGEVLSCTGESHEALELIETALRLDPHYPPSYLFALGQAYQLLGRHDEAIAAYRRLLARNPDHSRAHWLLAVLYYEVGREGEARAAVAACRRASPSYSFELMRTQVPYRDRSIAERWVEILREIETRDTH